jgi:tetratricopeptide (TPR) repeat protein
MSVRGCNLLVRGLLVGAIALGPSVARAQPDAGGSAAVDQHLARGLELYGDGAYEAALLEFRAGFALEARPELLFALAQAERKSGDCASALVYYRRFLGTEPPAEQAAAAQLQLDRCQEALGSAPETEGRVAAPVDRREAAPPPVIVTPEPAAAIGGEAPRRDAWYRDRLGVGLLAGGAAGTLVGLGLLSSANGAANDARDAVTYDDYDRSASVAERRQLLGAVVAAGGAVVLGVAAYRLIVKRRSAAPARTVEVGVVGGGVSLSWRSRF